jgi:hypothetical protein
MKWTTKARIQRILSRVPGGYSIYTEGQKRFGRMDAVVGWGVQHGTELVERLTQNGINLEGLTTLEIGTGRSVTVPLLFWLFGQQQCSTYDITPLLRPEQIVNAAIRLTQMDAPSQFFAQRQDRLEERIPGHFTKAPTKALIRASVKALSRELLQMCNIHYHAPCDAAEHNEAVDLAFSVTVLEHVPTEEIDRIFQRMFEIVRPGGYMAHLIDPTDHFAHQDSTIPLNHFLHYSTAEFSKYNTPFCYQNRLRPSHYKMLLERAGFRVHHWEVAPLSEGARIDASYLHNDYNGLPVDEIHAGTIYVIAQKPL